MPPAVFEVLRRRMVEDQLVRRGIRNPALLRAFGRLPREQFVPADRAEEAYEDRPVPIGEGQTLSQPYVVALMLEALKIKPGSRVLEIGTGSGYQTALLAEMGTEVYSIERIDSLAASAMSRLKTLGIGDRVHIRIADGSSGWPEAAPFDGIVVSAAAPAVPEPLAEQLAEGGRMVLPVGELPSQELVRVERVSGRFRQEALGGCAFVPLIGAHGYRIP